MTRLVLATFLRPEEHLTPHFAALAHELGAIVPELTVVVVGERPDAGFDAPFGYRCLPGASKYARILALIDESPQGYLLFVDHDITPDSQAIIGLMTRARSDGADLAWGRIGVTPARGWVARLIELDKVLSHSYLRPLLWAAGVGISVPGQVLLLRGAACRGRISRADTRLDDLSLGLDARELRLRTLAVKTTLGRERPQTTLRALLAQRQRWGRGFAELLGSSREARRRFLLLTHAFTYHLGWLIPWGIALALVATHPVGAALAAPLAVALTGPRALRWTLYWLVMPVAHMAWIVGVLKFSLLRKQETVS